jgi:hypothetical protein
MANPTNEPPIGSICAMKDLYNHASSTQPWKAKWSEIQDPVLEECRLKALGESHIIVRRYSRKQTEDAWAVHSIELKSQLLRAIFGDIFQDYPNWFPDDNPFTFFPPFKPLVHRWENFNQKYKAETNKEAKMQLHIFRREVEPLLSTNMSALKEAKLTGVLDFKSLWLLFAPGDLMISHEYGNDCLFKLVAAELIGPDDDNYDFAQENRRKPYWKLTLGQSDWDGSRSGFAVTSKKVLQFDQPQLFRRMDVYPFAFAQDQQKIEERLLARGRMFEKLRGYHVKTCTGRKFVMRRESSHDSPKLVDEPVSEPPRWLVAEAMNLALTSTDQWSRHCGRSRFLSLPKQSPTSALSKNCGHGIQRRRRRRRR